MSEYETLNIFQNDIFSPLQYEVLTTSEKIIVLCAGRRVGKSFIGSRVITQWIFRDIEKVLQDIKDGIRNRWAGEHESPSLAQLRNPDVLYAVIAPREEHLNQIRNYFLDIFSKLPQFKHPKFPDYFTDRRKKFWIWHEGVCARIDFIPASSEASMVSKGLNGAWIDEAGFIPNDRWEALSPTLWEHQGRILATGTPTLGEDHWFSQKAISGLRAGDERFDESEVPADLNTRTFIADTIHHAYLREARIEAYKASKIGGVRFKSQYIDADWRVKSFSVYSEFQQKIHVKTLSRPPYDFNISPGLSSSFEKKPLWNLGNYKIFTEPDHKYGLVDWSGGTAPGAVIVVYCWNKNPLNPKDPRRLLVAVEDYEGHEAYNSNPGNWWSILSNLERSHGIDIWIGDPNFSGRTLIKAARKAGISMKEGAAQDKVGRVSLVSSQLNHDLENDIYPALFINPRCTNLIRQIKNYRYSTDKNGNSTDKFKQYDDHCIDCLALLMPEVAFGGTILIGNQSFS